MKIITLVFLFMFLSISTYSCASIETVTQTSTFHHVTTPYGSMNIKSTDDKSIVDLPAGHIRDWPHTVVLSVATKSEDICYEPLGFPFTRCKAFTTPSIICMDGCINKTGYPKEATRLEVVNGIAELK